MSELTSTRNPRVLEVAALHRVRGRREQGRHLVEGPHAVQEAVRAGVVEEVFVTPDPPDGLELPAGLRVTTVRDHVMQRLADTRSPQGVVAVARTATAGLDDVVGSGLLVVLFEVADPGNLGTIIRTADAAGAAAVAITADSADAFAPKCVRAAAGSIYHLPVAVGQDIHALIAACRARGQRVVALDGRAPVSVFSLGDGARSLALVLGNEAHGLPDAVTAAADTIAAVPIRGGAESLNVAAAGAVAIYAAADGLDRSS